MDETEGPQTCEKLIYIEDMASGRFFDEDFKAAVVRAGAQARIDTLNAGVPVFYWDSTLGVDVMEHPSGQKFEIQFLPGLPAEENYKLIRELHPASV